MMPFLTPLQEGTHCGDQPHREERRERREEKEGKEHTGSGAQEVNHKVNHSGRSVTVIRAAPNSLCSFYDACMLKKMLSVDVTSYMEKGLAGIQTEYLSSRVTMRLLVTI